MSGVPVLVTIEGIGPIAGRLLVEWRDVETLWEDDDSRTAQRGAWQVEIDEVPARHLDAIRRAVSHLGPAAQIRIWGKPEAAHYVGMAYGQFGDSLLRARSLTLLGNGQATRVRL